MLHTPMPQFRLLAQYGEKLLPRFIMREIGATVNETLKIHCTDPTSKYHCITFSGSDLKTLLHINGTFCFFRTKRPTAYDLKSCDKIFITINP